MNNSVEYLRSLAQCFCLGQRPASSIECADRLLEIANEIEQLQDSLNAQNVLHDIVEYNNTDCNV